MLISFPENCEGANLVSVKLVLVLSYEIGLINDNDFLLLYPSYNSQNSICFLELDRTACNSNHKTKYKH